MTVSEILAKHITLEVECMDRLFLTGYIPLLQTGGGLVNFFVEHRKKPIPSPALLNQMTLSFRKSVERYAEENRVPLHTFEKGPKNKVPSKDSIAKVYRKKNPQTDGVNFIGNAQEKTKAFKGAKRKKSGYVGFDYQRQDVYVTHYYFYLYDDDFGPAFIKVCTYFPFTMKININGHEWAKRQLEKHGIGYEPLDNGFVSCEKPDILQQICDQLGPEQINRFFRKWLHRLPTPFTEADIEAGYQYELSISQMETSLTLVFDQAKRGREFFEETIRENLDLGRPDRVQMVFGRKITKATPGLFRTRVINKDVSPSLHIEYKNSRIKQYFKEQRALRGEVTINNTRDFYVGKKLKNLPFLKKISSNINRQLLFVQKVSSNCSLSGKTIEHIVNPTMKDGQRASGLKFGDRRVMALFAALCLFIHVPNGFTNAMLKQPVANLLDQNVADYSIGKMTYDLRRLRLKGIIHRLDHSNRYIITPYGYRVALFMTRINSRLFRPAYVALNPDNQENIPNSLLKAFQKVDQEIEKMFVKNNIKIAA
jgi:hypothetical protein